MLNFANCMIEGEVMINEKQERNTRNYSKE